MYYWWDRNGDDNVDFFPPASESTPYRREDYEFLEVTDSQIMGTVWGEEDCFLAVRVNFRVIITSFEHPPYGDEMPCGTCEMEQPFFIVVEKGGSDIDPWFKAQRFLMEDEWGLVS